jgi:hypothetical protein
MAPDLYNLDRRIRFWSLVFVGIVLGFRVGLRVYSGPSIAVGLSIAFGVAVALGLVALWLGERVWRAISWLVWFFF